LPGTVLFRNASHGVNHRAARLPPRRGVDSLFCQFDSKGSGFNVSGSAMAARKLAEFGEFHRVIRMALHNLILLANHQITNRSTWYSSPLLNVIALPP
jgi:hypothetical protein